VVFNVVQQNVWLLLQLNQLLSNVGDIRVSFAGRGEQTQLLREQVGAVNALLRQIGQDDTSESSESFVASPVEDFFPPEYTPVNTSTISLSVINVPEPEQQAVFSSPEEILTQLNADSSVEQDQVTENNFLPLSGEIGRSLAVVGNMLERQQQESPEQRQQQERRGRIRRIVSDLENQVSVRLTFMGIGGEYTRFMERYADIRQNMVQLQREFSQLDPSTFHPPQPQTPPIAYTPLVQQQPAPAPVQTSTPQQQPGLSGSGSTPPHNILDPVVPPSTSHNTPAPVVVPAPAPAPAPQPDPDPVVDTPAPVQQLQSIPVIHSPTFQNGDVVPLDSPFFRQGPTSNTTWNEWANTGAGPTVRDVRDLPASLARSRMALYRKWKQMNGMRMITISRSNPVWFSSENLEWKRDYKEKQDEKKRNISSSFKENLGNVLKREVGFVPSRLLDILNEHAYIENVDIDRLKLGYLNDRCVIKDFMLDTAVTLMYGYQRTIPRQEFLAKISQIYAQMGANLDGGIRGLINQKAEGDLLLPTFEIDYGFFTSIEGQLIYPNEKDYFTRFKVELEKGIERYNLLKEGFEKLLKNNATRAYAFGVQPQVESGGLKRMVERNFLGGSNFNKGLNNPDSREGAFLKFLGNFYKFDTANGEVVDLDPQSAAQKYYLEGDNSLSFKTDSASFVRFSIDDIQQKYDAETDSDRKKFLQKFTSLYNAYLLESSIQRNESEEILRALKYENPFDHHQFGTSVAQINQYMADEVRIKGFQNLLELPRPDGDSFLSNRVLSLKDQVTLPQGADQPSNEKADKLFLKVLSFISTKEGDEVRYKDKDELYQLVRQNVSRTVLVDSSYDSGKIYTIEVSEGCEALQAFFGSIPDATKHDTPPIAAIQQGRRTLTGRYDRYDSNDQSDSGYNSSSQGVEDFSYFRLGGKWTNSVLDWVNRNIPAEGTRVTGQMANTQKLMAEVWGTVHQGWMHCLVGNKESAMRAQRIIAERSDAVRDNPRQVWIQDGGNKIFDDIFTFVGEDGSQYTEQTMSRDSVRTQINGLYGLPEGGGLL
jgi:hypothetical protein